MTETPDDVQEKVRDLMAKINATPARGFDTARIRQAYMDELDALLDQWNNATGGADT